MTPQDIKNSVWQLAVQGKLVEQHSEEGTGEELFRQIQAEKETLIKAGKIKKSKMLPVISDDEKPFDLPDSWCWVRLEDLCSLITDGTHKTPSYTTEGVRFLSVKDISSGYFDLSNTKYISQSEHAVLTQRCKPEQGDVLICRIGTLGKALAVNIDLEFSIFVSLGLIKPINKELSKYIETVINSGYGFSWIQKVKVGGGTHTFKINLDDLRLFPIPLPPIGEQQRIVAKLDEITPLINRYEQAWSKLEEFNKRFPVDMQKSILQMAIQGKLVEQRPEEGTGEDLFLQIQAEKRALIKAGTIKKEKPLPEIIEDEIPFDIPESWKWYRIGELFNIVNGFTPLKSNPEFWTDGDIPWFTFEDVHRQGRFISSTEKFITRKALAKNTERIVPADTVLLCCTASVGEYAYTKIPLTTNQQFNAFVVKEYYKNAVYPLYVFEYAKTLKGSLIDRAGKTTFNFVSVGKLSNMLIPLPPLAEQKRIVAKLEEILPLCGRLK